MTLKLTRVLRAAAAFLCFVGIFFSPVVCTAPSPPIPGKRVQSVARMSSSGPRGGAGRRPLDSRQRGQAPVLALRSAPPLLPRIRQRWMKFFSSFKGSGWAALQKQ